MVITVVGTGYVGLVVGTCLADLGFQVTCIDNVAAKIDRLRQGIIPIYEPGLEPLVHRNVDAGRLHFDTEADAAIAAADVVFIAVGTPPDEDGAADVSVVLGIADRIGKAIARPTTIVLKSTVPVGTADRVAALVATHAKVPFDVVSNPEFLKEGAAIDDFMRPDRIVVGCATERARNVMAHLYGSLVRSGNPILFMDNRSAELTKYASNALLATKISFMNELARLCDRVGADVEQVRRGTGSDSRIGHRFLFAGAGYGGSCFPKDVRALIRTGREAGVMLRIPTAVEEVNAEQKHVLADLVIRHFDGDVRGRVIAIWGLAFKPGTDDVRDAPALVVATRLAAAGANVRVFDPEAMTTARCVLGDAAAYAESPLDAARGADALVLVTEWSVFRNPDLAELGSVMRGKVVFDGRNVYDPDEMQAAGFTWYGIGRGKTT